MSQNQVCLVIKVLLHLSMLILVFSSLVQSVKFSGMFPDYDPLIMELIPYTNSKYSPTSLAPLDTEVSQSW